MSRSPEIALEGVGSIYAKYGSLATVGAPFMNVLLNDFSIAFDSTEVDLRLGESKFASERIATEKNLTMSGTSAVIRIRDIKLTQGHSTTSDVVSGEDVPMVAFREIHTIPSTGAGSLKIAFTDLDYIAADADYPGAENVIIEYADGSGEFAKASVAAEQVFVEDAVTNYNWSFHADDAGVQVAITYVYNYDYDTDHVTDGIESKILNTQRENCPFAMIYSKKFVACNATKMFQLYLYKAQAGGRLTIPQAKGDYNKPDFELVGLYDGRPDNRLGIVTIQNYIATS